MAPSRCARSIAIRDFDPGDSNALTRTLVSRTQRNYAPFRSESRTSGVSPRACALRPASSSTCSNDGSSLDVNSRSQSPTSACIFSSLRRVRHHRPAPSAGREELRWSRSALWNSRPHYMASPVFISATKEAQAGESLTADITAGDKRDVHHSGENGGRPDLSDLSLLKVEENHAGPGCSPIFPIPAKPLKTRRHGYQRILLPLSTPSQNRTTVGLRTTRQRRLYYDGPVWPCTHAL